MRRLRSEIGKDATDYGSDNFSLCNYLEDSRVALAYLPFLSLAHYIARWLPP
jgi:hypothetical protein